MKPPYLDQYQRTEIRNKTLQGAFLELKLASDKLKRSIYKDYLKQLNDSIKKNCR